MSKFTLDLRAKLEPDVSLLTHPTIPHSLWSLNPRTLMGQEAWDTMRTEVFNANAYHCYACGTHASNAWKHQWLEGHEVYTYDVHSMVASLDRVVGLCHCCHMFIHAGSLRTSTYTPNDIRHVIQRGFMYLDGKGMAGEANADSIITLRLYDEAYYATLFGDNPPPYYTLPQGGWTLRYNGHLWKRSMNRVYVKPDDKESNFTLAKFNSAGGLE